MQSEKTSPETTGTPSEQRDDVKKPDSPWYPDERPWIEWGGGECPLPVDQFCEVLCRNEREDRTYIHQRLTAANWGPWDHFGSSLDIVAYLPLGEGAR